MRDERTERAYGPYKHRRRWKVIVVGTDGRRVTTTFAHHATAAARVDEINAKADGRTVSAAIDAYLEHLRGRGLGSGTIKTAGYRLRGLLDAAGRDRAISSLPSVAGELFERRRVSIARETQDKELEVASAFARWAMKQGWMRGDPFAELEPIGERKRGKPKLKIDEARVFRDVALAEGTLTGLASALALLTGARASEITDRVVRDVDDGARILWVENAKTEAGNRKLEIPEELRPRMTELVAGRGGGERLWGDVDRHWLAYHVVRLAKVAGVSRVTPHGLRGTIAELETEARGARAAADLLGHVDAGVTVNNYAGRGAVYINRQRAALRVINGGGR